MPFVVKMSSVSPAFASANSDVPPIYRTSFAPSAPTSAVFFVPSPVRSKPVLPS